MQIPSPFPPFRSCSLLAFMWPGHSLPFVLSCGFRAQSPEWVILQQLINSDGRIIEKLAESPIKALWQGMHFSHSFSALLRGNNGRDELSKLCQDSQASSPLKRHLCGSPFMGRAWNNISSSLSVSSIPMSLKSVGRSLTSTFFPFEK